MWVVYSALALAEVGVLFASVIALFFFVVRALFRVFRRSKRRERKFGKQGARTFVTRPASQTSSV